MVYLDFSFDWILLTFLPLAFSSYFAGYNQGIKYVCRRTCIISFSLDIIKGLSTCVDETVRKLVFV